MRGKMSCSPYPAITALIICLPFGSLVAGEFWDQKPHAEWTAAEAWKVLTDSPWSKTAILQLNLWDTLEEPGPIALSKRSLPGEKCACCDAAGNTGALPGSAGMGMGTGWGSAPARQAVYYRVLFFSSIRVRQAMARLAQLDGETISQPTQEWLRDPLPDYVVALTGPYIGAFLDGTLESLKPSTHLRAARKGGADFELKQFTSPKRRNDGLALFVFSRGTAETPPFETSGDARIDFVTGEGKSKIKATFRLDRMTADGMPDY